MVRRQDGKKRRLRLLRLHDEASAFSREQFIKPPSAVPWKSIFLACILFFFGALGIVLGALIMTDVIKTTEWEGRGKPLIVLGTLIFIPGFYHVRLAYYAWKGYKGYDFDQIPDLE